MARPRVEELVMSCGGPEVPHDRLVPPRQKREPRRLVRRPRSNVGCGDVADVVHVEEKQRAHVGCVQSMLRAREAFATQSVEVGALLPVDGVESVGFCQTAHLRHNLRASAATLAAVGTVKSSSSGENGTGTSIAPIRLTGASR